MKSFTLTICFLFVCLSFSQEKEKTYDAIDTILLKGIHYTIGINAIESSFELKISTSDSTRTSLAMNRSIPKETLRTVVINIVKKIDTSLTRPIDSTENNYLLGLKSRVDEYYEKQVRADLTEAQNVIRDVDKEKDQYSAKLVLNKTVPYIVKSPNIKKSELKKIKRGLKKILKAKKKNNYLSNDVFQKYVDFSAFGKFFNQSELQKYISYTINDVSTIDTNAINEINAHIKFDRLLNKFEYKGKNTDTLKIIDANLTFFNNKASSIYIKAELIIDDNTKEELIFYNNEFSVPLRFFNNYGSQVWSQRKNGEIIIIELNDVFNYESDKNFNYSIANSQIALSHSENSKKPSEDKIIQRRFFDFFTAVVYSDVMAFNSENANSILNAQAKLLIPMNLLNWGKWAATRQFTTTTNIALDNSFQNDTRFIGLIDNDTVSNFDLLRKNNLFGKIELDLISYESKGWFLTTSLGYNVGFYRTGIRHTDTQNDVDVPNNVIEKQIFSLGHGPYLNFEIRPQNNFGADVRISIEDLNFSDSDTIGNRNFDNIIFDKDDKDDIFLPYNLINLEANFYWLTNPDKSRGGVYAKVGTYFHTPSNSIFPQIQVGYATNLTSFVNRFKPSKPKTPDTKSDN